MTDRKHSIRKKYSLDGFVGKLGNELQLQEGTNFIQQISHEELDVLTVGNLNTYTYSIENDKVRNWLKSLKFSYKKERDISEI